MTACTAEGGMDRTQNIRRGGGGRLEFRSAKGKSRKDAYTHLKAQVV